LIIGAGISGLVAARILADRGRRVLVVDRSSTLGGRVRSVTLGSATVDAGATHIWSFYSRTRAWLQQLGLGNELIPAGGMGALGASWRDLPGVVRSGFDVARFWRRLDFSHPERAAPFDSASIRDYASHHLREQLTLSSLIPAFEWNAFCSLEELSQVLLLQSGRLFLGARPYRLKGGLQQFPERLARGLDVRLGPQHTVKSLAHGPHLVVARLANGSVIDCSAVVVATGPGEAADLVDVVPAEGRFLRGVGHSAVVREWRELRGPLTSQSEPLRLALGERLQGVALARPALGNLLVSLALYGPGVREMGDGKVQTALERLGGELVPRWNQSLPVARAGYRWPRAVTIFSPGHFRSLAQLRLGQLRGRVVLAGDYLVSPTVEGAAVSGQRAAAEVMRLPILDE